MKIAILGCGPAGLLAAHAVRLFDPAIGVLLFSVKAKSPLYGCQYLHEPIEGITDATAYRTVDYRLRGGTAEDYRTKVYGESSTLEVSPTKFDRPHRAWDLRATYDELWGRWKNVVLDTKMGAAELRVFQGVCVANDVAKIITTIPAPQLCHKRAEHTFVTEPIWAMGDAPDKEQLVPLPIPKDTIICDASREVSWYRASNVYDHSTIEWPGERTKPPLAGVRRVNKPLSTDCDCNPDILRVGRMGTWQKGYLSHQAYYETLAQLGRGIQGTLL